MPIAKKIAGDKAPATSKTRTMNTGTLITAKHHLRNVTGGCSLGIVELAIKNQGLRRMIIYNS